MVDWRGGLDKVVDGTVRGIDKGKQLLGEGVDAATDKVGAGLDKVGAHDWADKVEDWGDETASSLGAEVGEKQLGQTDEANELIHGRPEKITATVKNLRDFQRAFDLVGGGMKKLDSGHWRGEAADAFRAKFSTLPTDWLRAADSFEDAAKALETYASAVTSAQSKARAAIALYKEGTQDSEKAVAAYNKKVDAYNAARNGDDPLPHPGSFSDPGVNKRKRAQEDLEDARRLRNEAGGRAESAVTAAMAHAPREPEGAARLKNEVYDRGISRSVELAHLGGGVLKGVGGLANFLRQTNPLDPYNLTHPAEMFKGVTMTLSGLTRTVANPDRALEGAWDAARSDPSEFVGRLLPEAVGTKGAGTLRGGLRAGLRKSGGPEGPQKPPGPAREGTQDPAKHSRTERAPEEDPSDPVDMATGAMYLPQTDIVLPGTLPLVFRRRVASDYRSGRWFGPSWSSTADQRLEIDSEGVIFVSEGGLLLPYPHPAPGVPVLPSHGPRWPLDRESNGDYTITDPESGLVRRFTTLDDGTEALLTQLDDRNGNWITFEHDVSGAPSSIVHHGGYHVKLTTESGRITALHLVEGSPDGDDQQILRYGYTDGHLTEITNSSGLPLRFTYDGHGRVTSWTDSNDSAYQYAYDERGRCITEGGSAGHMALNLEYTDPDPATGHRVTTATTSGGAVHHYLINEAHQIIAETNPLGATTSFVRDHRNRLLSRTDPLGRVMRFTYDPSGRLTTAVRADGGEVTAEYNSLGLPTRITNPDRTVVRYEYDDHGNRIAVTDPSGAATHTTYNEAGHPTSITDALGNTTRIHSNAAGLPVEITDPLGATTRIERDAFGRPVAVTDPLGAITRMAWTPEGKLARRTDADGSTQSWTYDGEGNCLTHTDAMGSISRFEYTHFDLLSARVGPDGVRYEFTHDHELRLTRVLNPQGLNWTYVYDPAGRLISETDFDNRTLSYTRDAAGRLTTRTNALGQTTRYERDELDRIVRKDASGTVTTFAYDLTGQLAEAVNADATVTWLRDQYGRLKSETVNGRTLSYTYDELGRRTSRTTPSGVVSTWAYDAAGRRSSLTTSGRTLTFEHDAAGREVTRRFGEHVAFASQFDTMGRLTTQEITGAGRSIQRRAYTYRADGHLVGLTDQLVGTKTFDVDMAGRVTAVHAANWTERYAYDAAGNQTDASWPEYHPGQEAVGTRSYTGTTITRAGKVHYEHDALGRTTLRQRTRLSRKPDTWRYEWDAEDRMRSVTTPDAAVWHYKYDALGRRIEKKRLTDSNSFDTVSFTWDGGTLCEETKRSSEFAHLVTMTWNHRSSRPITQLEHLTTATDILSAITDRFFAVSTDPTGTATELVDELGNVSWKARADLWGTTSWSKGSTAYTPLRFPGQYHDPESGLHYNFARYYDPSMARYLTPDPLGLAPAPNPASYVLNPHTTIDPSGLAPTDYEKSGDSPAGPGPWDMTGRDPMSLVPDHAKIRELSPDPNGGAQYGLEYIWRDSGDRRVRLRIHGPDRGDNVPLDSSSRWNEVYRIQIAGRYQDMMGNLHHRQAHNPNSPHYDPDSASGTHMIWPEDFNGL
ncbi:putative T7SS-secreted protein [Streptomyces sp. SID8016]|uniref:putative T7SS-secreted protein n=1 Tax=Streptomyces sp. SID8016 TaxID=2706098 RepID=UPI0013DCB328|nr:type IV secretion protein Rhs [Streptomyces sp. SID8016]